MTVTRPDLCFVVNKLSQCMVKPVPEKPTVTHLTMAKHVLRYLKGTIDYCLIFKKFESLVWRIFATNIPSECLFLRFPLFKKNLQHPVSSYKSRAALLPRLMQSQREFASAASY